MSSTATVSVETSERRRGSLAAEIAAELGISERQLYRDGQFAEAVDEIEQNLGPDVKATILAGRGPCIKDVIALRGKPADEQRAVIARGRARRQATSPRRERPVGEFINDMHTKATAFIGDDDERCRQVVAELHNLASRIAAGLRGAS